MLLLSIDTSGKDGSIALACGNVDGACDVIEVVPLAGGTFSAQLVPQISALLAKHGFSKHDIAGFVVVSGPGSFTGLRVGLAVVKALAEILGKPIAVVSRLEASVHALGSQGRITALLDAGRGEVYVGEYEVQSDSAKVQAERLLTREEAWSSARESRLVTSDKVLAESARAAGLAVLTIEPIHAGTIAKLGWRKIESGDTVSPEQLEANYIRRSDAELFVKSGS